MNDKYGKIVTLPIVTVPLNAQILCIPVKVKCPESFDN